MLLLNVSNYMNNIFKWGCILILLAGCSNLEIGRKSVPSPVLKSEKQKEAEKVGADFLARKVEKPDEAKQVAVNLSTSLGTPKKIEDDPEKVIRALRENIQKQQSDINKLNEELEAFKGKKIDGTGINVTGIGLSGSVIALIVLCILFPPVLTVVFFIIKNLKRTIECLVTGVQDLIERDPNAGRDFLGSMSRRMDTKQKGIVKTAKKRVDQYR